MTEEKPKSTIKFASFLLVILLIYLTISFLLTPLINVAALRKIVHKWLLIYMIIDVVLLWISNSRDKLKLISGFSIVVSPITWLLYGTASIWYIRLFLIDWYWYMLYPGFLLAIFIFMSFYKENLVENIFDLKLFKILCFIPVVLGLIRCLFWGDISISWSQTLLLGLMNYVGGIQVVYIGGSIFYFIRNNFSNPPEANEKPLDNLKYTS